jgi:hypothetical protein
VSITAEVIEKEMAEPGSGWNTRHEPGPDGRLLRVWHKTEGGQHRPGPDDN